MALKDVTEKMRDEQQAALGETAFFAAQTAEKVDTTNELLVTQIKIFDKQFKGLKRDKNSKEGDTAEGEKRKKNNDKKTDGKFSKLFGFFKNQKKDKKKSDEKFKLFSMKTLKFFGLFLLGIVGIGLALLALSKSIGPIRKLLDNIKDVVVGDEEVQEKRNLIEPRRMGASEQGLKDKFKGTPVLNFAARGIGLALDKITSTKKRGEQFNEIADEEMNFYQKSRMNVLKFREQFGFGALMARMNDEAINFQSEAYGIIGRLFKSQKLQDKQKEIMDAVIQNGTFRERQRASFNTKFVEQKARFEVQDKAIKKMGIVRGTLFGFDEGIVAPVTNVLGDTVATLGTILPGGIGEMSRNFLKGRRSGREGIGDLRIERQLAKFNMTGRTQTELDEFSRLKLLPNPEIYDRLEQIEIDRIRHLEKQAIRLKNLEDLLERGPNSQLLGTNLPIIVNAPTTDNSQIHNSSGGFSLVGMISDALNREDRFGLARGYGSSLIQGM
jgi:hypothetical protein